MDRCQVYVGIIGGRYGSGITEAEYRRARAREIPCFIYLKDERQTGAEEHEADREKTACLAAFKAALHRAHTVSLFSTPDDLAARLTADLHGWLCDEYLTPWLARAGQGEFSHEDEHSLPAPTKALSALSRGLRAELQGTGYLLASGSRSVAAQTILDSTVTTGDVHYHFYAARPLFRAPNQAPPLPARFVPRPEVSRG